MSLKESMRNMKVKKKLVVFGSIMGALVVILGVFSAVSSILMNRQLKDITDNWVPTLVAAKELDTLTSDFRLQQYGHITSVTDEDMNRYETALVEIDAQVTAKSKEMETFFVMDEEVEYLRVIRERWAQYLELSTQIMQMSRNGQKAEAGELMVGEAFDVYDNFGAVFDELVEFEQMHTDDSEASAEMMFTVIIIAIICVILIAAIIVLRLSSIMTVLITEPLAKVKASMDKMYKEGNLNFELEYNAKDEFGELVSGINQFVKSLVTILKDEGYLMSEMAKGNFNVTSKATDAYIGDFQQVLNAMRGIKLKLGNALAGIADSAKQVNLASDQLASESQSLADGATQQAAAVEDILETIEKTEQESIASAEQAVSVSKYADDVMDKAQKSNEQMKAMVDEMNLLNETSKKISSIIDAIEDIASQTNLLSLNASIEAARAGEAGRGFAVVAGEIGKLAMQCSESASNTRDLIGAAISQTQRGDAIASETAEALFAVSEGITQIAELSENVKSSSQNQAAALRKVSARMEKIAEIVESNSASAEESSAASEELAAHSMNLTDMLSEFQFTSH